MDMDSYFVEINEELKITSYTKSFIEDIVPEKCVMGYNILSIFDSTAKDALLRIFESCRSGNPDTVITGMKTLVASTTSNNFPVRIDIPWKVNYIQNGFSIEADRLGDEHKILQAEELKDFFNMAPIALHWLSDDGKVLWANDRELEVLGYSREEYIGEDIMKFCPDSHDDVLSIFKELGSGNSIKDVPIRFRTKDGRIKDLLIDSNVNYKEDGSFNHTRCFIRDDTGRKIREAREETRKALSEKLSSEKERFISKVIHHIKTPLHIMRMQVGIGCEKEEIDMQLHGMAKMMTNLSDAVKFDEGYIKPMDIVNCDLSEFFSNFKIENIRSSVKFISSNLSNSKVRVDTKMLTTIIEEIVLFCDGNSSDGYSSDGFVTVDVKNLPNSEKYSFRISCKGKKLNEVDVQRLFHNYWTSDTFDKKDNSPTLGVGLNIAFNYTQCMNSDLFFHSDDQYIRFTFDLNLESVNIISEKRESISTHWDGIKSSEDTNIVSSISQTSLGLNDRIKSHILVVEDNTICQKLLKRVINKLGHTCDVADNGSIAVDMICKTEYVVYDIIFMDIRMPIMDGIEATRIISEYVNNKGIKLPIIAVSAENHIKKDSGFASFLQKPTRHSDIEKVIREYVL